MSGFDNGTLQGGIFFQTKQFGSILRGFGPPLPQAGVVGDLYIDVQTWNLYGRRSTGADPWGYFLFVVPVTYQTRLKWFVSSAPANSIGIDGDYALLRGGFPNYGMQPSIYGPKAAGVWPANPALVTVSLPPKVLDGTGGSASPYTAQPDDETLIVDQVTGAPFTVNVDWSQRTRPLRVVDGKGDAAANNITITPAAGQTQLAALNFSYVIEGNGGSIILTPLSDGSGAY